MTLTLSASWANQCASGSTEVTVNLAINGTYDFDYSGSEVCAIIAKAGYYKLEVWGASGGGNTPGTTQSSRAGAGGYAIGVVKTSKKELLYFVVGGKGNVTYSGIPLGGYNGGGSGGQQDGFGVSSGGGATHIATVPGTLSLLEDYKGALINDSYYESDYILIVAGGGGGSDNLYGSYNSDDGTGGSGGGYIGDAGRADSTRSSRSRVNESSMGGTQTVGFSFGKGEDANTCYDYGGGGGGFYGGFQSVGSCPGHTDWGAGGGSGYIASSRLISTSTITKHMASFENPNTSTDNNLKTDNVTCVDSDVVVDCGKIGNGYARITYLGTTI